MRRLWHALARVPWRSGITALFRLLLRHGPWGVWGFCLLHLIEHPVSFHADLTLLVVGLALARAAAHAARHAPWLAALLWPGLLVAASLA